MADSGSYVPPGHVTIPSPTQVKVTKVKKPKNTKFKPIAQPDPVQVGKVETSPVGWTPITPGSATYNRIKAADYHLIDPAEFARKYGETARAEMGKNLAYGQQAALSTLNTELQGLQNFVPAAATLKRSEISIDNQFNQAQRTQQVNQALPGAEKDLLNQNKRANSYALGKLPEGFDDDALNTQIRSDAADNAAAGGFGVNSAVSRRASGLMSARERLGIAQYGEQLLNSNIGTRAGLYLAPTEYSDAGSQIRVTPEVGAGRLTTGYASEANSLGMVSANTALSTQVNQEQFSTNLNQQTNQFNASNDLQNSQFNVSTDQNRQANNQKAQMAADQFNSNQNVAVQGQNISNQYAADVYNQQTDLNLKQWNISTRLNNANNNRNRNVSIDEFNANAQFQADTFNANAANNFKLTGFQYEVGYQGALAGTANANTNLGIDRQQQQQAMNTFSDFLGQGQAAGTAGSIASGLGTILGATSIGSSITSALGGGQAGATQQPGQTQPVQPVSAAAPGQAPQPAAGASVSSGGFQAPAPIGSSGGGGGGEPNVGYSPSGQPVMSIDTSGSGFDSAGNWDGQTPIMSSPGGMSQGYSAPAIGDNPQSFAAPSERIATFDKDVGGGSLTQTLQNDPQAEATRAQLSAGAAAVNGAAGFSDTPGPGMVPANVTSGGKQTYVSPVLQQSNNPKAGETTVDTLGKVLDPFGVFTAEDRNTWSQIAKASSDTTTLMQLTQLQQAGDTKGFVNLALSRFGQPAAEAMFKDPQNKAGVGVAFAAHSLLENWDQMSSTQKSLGLAALGMKAYKFGTGDNLATKAIIKPNAPGDPGLNVGQALSLMQSGYNVYSLAKNWDQLNTMQKIVYGTGDAAQIATTARNMGLLGSGTNGAAVATNPQALAAAGWSSTPNVGVGAMSAAKGTPIPEGFTQVPAATKDGSVIAVPKGNAASAAPSSLDQFAGGAMVAAGAMAVYQGWGKGGTRGAIQGAAGGSAIAAGLYTQGVSNPYVLGAVVATSVLADTVKLNKTESGVAKGAVSGASTGAYAGSYFGPVGTAIGAAAGAVIGAGTAYGTMSKKSGDQVERDFARDKVRDVGISSQDHKVTLADGSTFDIGIDGHGGQHDFRFPEKLPEGATKRKLNAWDVDYSNDLDYSAAMGAGALTRMLFGGKGQGIDQMGSQLANAAIGNIGFGKDMTPQNFDKAMDNLRGMYSKAGIKNKADAFQLINQGYAEGRWNDTDMVSMQQAANMVFEKDYASANKLMQGRWKGIEVLAKAPKPTPAAKNPGNTLDGPNPAALGVGDHKGKTQYGNPLPPSEDMVTQPDYLPPGTDIDALTKGIAGNTKGIRPGYVPKSSKFEAQSLNARRYAGGVA